MAWASFSLTFTLFPVCTTLQHSELKLKNKSKKSYKAIPVTGREGS
jgi:hypothetical protein